MNGVDEVGRETGRKTFLGFAGRWGWIAGATVAVLAVVEAGVSIDDLGAELGSKPAALKSVDTADATGPDVARDWQSRAQSDLTEREYHASQSANGLQAPNRAHNLRAYFDASGIRLHDRIADGSAQLLSLSLVGLGRGENLREVSEGVVKSEGSRVEIVREDGLVEWYENGPAGLEQGFTLAETPSGMRGAVGDELVLELALEGAVAQVGGQDLTFVTEAGRELRYGQLWTKDATGRALESRIAAVSPERFRLVVDDEGAQYPIVIDPLISGIWDTQLLSDQAEAEFGYLVASAGDVNGDGLADVIIGAPRYDAGQSDEGAAFIYLGSANGIANGDPATAATQLESNQTDARMGVSVASAGDINGDGFDDIIVGSEYYDAGEIDEGAAFIYLGGPAGIADGNPATAHGRIQSNQTSSGLLSCGGAGDLNGDGFADVVINLIRYDTGSTVEPASFLFLGSPSGIPEGNPSTAWARINPNTGGAGNPVAWSTHAAGDVNGDGYGDLVSSRTEFSSLPSIGSAFVFHGGPASIGTWETWLSHDGSLPYEDFGWGASGAGDVNGDGFDDIIVASRGLGAESPGYNGAAFVFLGSASGIPDGGPATANTRLLDDPLDPETTFGSLVSSAGDVNGDGFADVLVGDPRFGIGGTEGAVHVFLGGPLGIADGGPDTSSFVVPSSQAGGHGLIVGAPAGDVNGDGNDDLIVGARGVADFAGAAFVYSGSPKVWTQSYAFAWADQPTAASYEPDTAYSFNAGRLAPTQVSRSSVGTYSVSFPGFNSVPGNGNVQVSHYGNSNAYCKVASWASTLVNVRCFNAAGAPSDERFTVLYLKPQPGTTATSYAWADLPGVASYSPSAPYAYNPSGGAITVTRAATGVYSITWAGASSFGIGGGHLQVTAYGTGSQRCKVASWGAESASIACFNAAGAPADAQFTALLIRPHATDEGLAFAWADQQATASYSPDANYVFNAAGGPVAASRLGVGRYSMTFVGLGSMGLTNGHVQVKAYGPLVDTRCSVGAWSAESVDVNCYDAAGSLVDSRYDVLFLRPIALPEPGMAVGIGGSVLALGASARRRNRDGRLSSR